MARIAVVTGGSRGIGEAISCALKDKGMTVVAIYAGNDQAAQEFTERTGIETRKWDVGDHQACIDGCAEIDVEEHVSGQDHRGIALTEEIRHVLDAAPGPQ